MGDVRRMNQPDDTMSRGTPVRHTSPETNQEAAGGHAGKELIRDGLVDFRVKGADESCRVGTKKYGVVVRSVHLGEQCYLCRKAWYVMLCRDRITPEAPIIEERNAPLHFQSGPPEYKPLVIPEKPIVRPEYIMSV